MVIEIPAEVQTRSEVSSKPLISFFNQKLKFIAVDFKENLYKDTPLT